MRRQLSVCLATVLFLVFGGFIAVEAAGDSIQSLMNAPVTVTLIDGRTPRGVLSPKTNDSALVLRTELSDLVVESRFSWGIVQAVNEIPISDAQPRPPAPMPITPADDNVVPPAPIDAEIQPQLPTFNKVSVIRQNVPMMANVEVPAGPAIPDLRRAVVSMNISATVANFNPNALADGLLLRVQPLDAFGNLVPAEGNLDIQLVGETKIWAGGQSIRRDDQFRTIENWTVPIHAINFTPAGTVVKLPFRNFNPDRDLDIAPDALVYARLRLPTAGVFEASDANVVLRPASRFRDDLQQYKNRRFLPIEGVNTW